MKRLWILTFVVTFTQQALALGVPGNVNFGLDQSPDDHAYKFRLIVNDSSITLPTKCIQPGTGLTQTLTYGAIGEPTSKLILQASDCSNEQDQWVNINGFLEYDSNYWYDLYVDMVHLFYHIG